MERDLQEEAGIALDDALRDLHESEEQEAVQLGMTRETLAIWSGCIAAAGLFLLYNWLVVFRVRPAARTEHFECSDGGSIPSPGTKTWQHTGPMNN